MFEEPRRWQGPQWIARLRVGLNDSPTPVQRTLDVDSTLSVQELHEVFQVSFGWTDSHVHEFTPGPTPSFSATPQGAPNLQLAIVDDSSHEGEYSQWNETLEERHVTVGQLMTIGHSVATYTYDFGDEWRLSVNLLDVSRPELETPRARIIEAVGPSPFDDIGGYPGFGSLFQALTTSDHANHASAWGEVEARMTVNTLGYEVSTRALVPGLLDAGRLNANLLQRFGFVAFTE